MLTIYVTYSTASGGGGKGAGTWMPNARTRTGMKKGLDLATVSEIRLFAEPSQEGIRFDRRRAGNRLILGFPGDSAAVWALCWGHSRDVRAGPDCVNSLCLRV